MKRNIALACFFLSGFAGLVYEICWIRKASLVFGSTTLAVSTVLAVFFAGLAVGSWWIGRRAVKLSRPLRLYAFFEIGLAIFAAATPLLFTVVDRIYGDLFTALAGRPVAMEASRVLLIAGALFIPTLLMGATLPLFCRQFVDRRARIAGSVGFLYGLNTLGAACGAAATGFWLLPRIGVSGSILLAAGLDVLAGVVVWSLRTEAPAAAVGAPAADSPQRPAPAADRFDRRRTLIVAGLFFVTGMVALGGEVLWTRFLALVVRNTVHTYTITLSVVLAGIVLGSWISARLFDRDLPRAAWFGGLQAAAALSMLVLMSLPATFWRGLGEGPWPYLVLLLPPATMSGALFPLAMRMVLDDPRLAAAGVGRMSAVNTVGGIAGSLVAGFWLLPGPGMAASLRILTLLGVLGAVIAWLGLCRGRKALRLGAAAVILAAWFAVPPLTDSRLPADLLAPRERLIDFTEGMSATLAVIRGEDTVNLEINRHWQGQDVKCHQIMAAHVPMIVHPAPRDVMVIGVGTGQTASRYLMYDIAGLDCVDIEPEIFPFIAEHYQTGWMDDPRVNLVGDDGRTYVAHGQRSYDVISVEVGQVFRPGVDAFYTREFYLGAEQRLRDGGLLSQFVPLSFLGPDELSGIIATFLDVFPESILWYNTSELLLIGFKNGEALLKTERLAMLGEGAVGEDLRFSQWGGPREWLNDTANFLGGFLCGPRGLRDLAAGGEIYSDDRPVLAYATSDAGIGQGRELPLVRLISRHLDPIGSLLDRPVDASSAEAVAGFRDANLADIVTSCHLREASAAAGKTQPRELVRMLTAALQTNPRSNLGNRMLAWAEAQAGDTRDAAGHYRAALDIRPDDYTARRELAAVLIHDRLYTDARTELNRLLTMRPDDVRVLNSLGAVLAAQGDLETAEKAFLRAIGIDPSDTDSRRNLDRVRAELRR